MDYATLKQRWSAWSKQQLDAALLAETTAVVEGMVATDVSWLDNQSFSFIPTTQGTLVTGAVYQYVRKVGTRVIRSINASGRLLEQMPIGTLFATYRTGNAAHPMNYAVVGSDFFIAPGLSDLELVLEARFDPLVADDDTNELLTQHPEVYIHAGVAHIHRYFQDMEASQMSDQMYNVAVMKANALDLTLAYGAAPSVRAV